MQNPIGRSRWCSGDHRFQQGFSLVEMLVAAAVLLIVSLGTFEALLGALRDADRHQKDMVAERMLLSAIGYMRDVGYDGLVASGSAAVGVALSSVYSGELGQLGPTALVNVAWVNSGQLLDATVSTTFGAQAATASMAMATRIVQGGPP